MVMLKLSQLKNEMRAKIPLYAAWGVLAGVLAFQLGSILFLNHGIFTYGLDDAYISLRMAENISHGNYGINAGEYSSPASSILWPFLLAPFSFMPFFIYVPLILNTAFSFGTVWLFYRGCALVYPKELQTHSTAFSLIISGFVLGFNLVGLTLMGMEHSLQVLLSAAVAYGLINEMKHKSLPQWFWLVLVLGPMVRYENLALTGCVGLYLLFRGYWRQVICAGIAVILALGSFSFFLVNLGLPALPLSVLTKLALRSPDIPVVLSNIQRVDAGAFLFLIGLCAYLWRKPLALCVLGTLLAHMFYGSIGWIRYDSYVIAFAVPILFALYSRQMVNFLKETPVILRNCRIMIAISCIFFVYFDDSLFRAPLAARDTHLMQHQIHRFINEFYKSPAAVNDIGYPSFGSDFYILDYAGLASRESAQIITGKAPAYKGWMDATADKRDICLAVVYMSWFKEYIPAEWRPVAVLKVSENIRTLAQADREFTFFATKERCAPELKELLAKFKATLPPESELKLAATP